MKLKKIDSASYTATSAMHPEFVNKIKICGYNFDLAIIGNFFSGFISILIFAGIHWGSGMPSVINSAMWAILPTYYSLRYRSANSSASMILYPCMIAHYITDFIAFY